MESILPEIFKYNGDFSSMKKLEDVRFRAILNAICATRHLNHAALELGVSGKTVIDFCGKHNITHRIRLQMRAHFSTLNVKIKYRYDHDKELEYEKEIHCQIP